MNYSGSTNFDFYIFREINGEDQEIALTIHGSSYYTVAKLWGDPENCYPDEGDTEIVSVTGPDGKSWEDELSDEERENIIGMIEDSIRDQDDDVDPDEDDDYYSEEEFD